MVNYATSEGFTFNMIMLKSFSLCADCTDIEVWDPSCSEKLGHLKDYKKHIIKFEFIDEYEIKQKDDMINELSLMISKLENLKNKI